VTSASRIRSSSGGIAAVTSAALNQRNADGAERPLRIGPIVRSPCPAHGATI